MIAKQASNTAYKLTEDHAALILLNDLSVTCAYRENIRH